jgi:filamentous hemagglutinin family protein
MPKNWNVKLAGLLAMGGTIAVLENPVVAQITPDTTLDGENSVVTPNVEIKGLPADLIEGGAIRDTNLFHSFLDFNVGEGGRVYFSNPAGIETIFSRVTGNDVSDILGTLGVNGQASLYLLNPNGIIFGKGARLDVPGSFVGTTADAVVFENGLTFSASNPDAPPLLTVNVTPGLQYGNNQTDASITNRGNLVVGQDLTLASGNLNLQGQVSAQRDVSLYAKDTVMMQDTISNPFIAAAGNQLEVEGANRIEILALNHANSGLFSGADLVLRSANPIKGNAHYTSGGSFRIEDLEGNWGQLTSPEDPVIRASGDVVLGGYVGASLHILAGGSVTISGDVIIQSPDPVNGIVETVTLSDGTTVLVDGKTQPTLDIRAGTTAFNIPDIQGIPATGIIVPPVPNPIGIPTSADITIGGIFFNAPDGVALITNQYQPNLSLPGGKITIEGISGVAISPNPDNPAATISSITIDSRDSIAVNGIVNASFLEGKGGDITLIGEGDIVTADIFSIGAVGGSIKLRSQGAIAWDNNLIGSASLSPIPAPNLRGGDIQIDANSVSLTNGARVIAGTLGAIPGGNITIQATESVEASGVTMEGAVNNPLLDAIPGVTEFLATVPSSGFYGITSGEGAAGDILIETQQFNLRSGARASTSSFGGGQGGDLTVKASNTVELTGTLNVISGLFTESSSSGDAGTLRIETGRLIIREGANVSGTTFAQGRGGDLEVNASESVEVIGVSLVEETPSLLSSGTLGTGDTGDLTINTRRLIIRDGGFVEVGTAGSGEGGDLTVNASESVEVIGKSPVNIIPSTLGTDTVNTESNPTGAGKAGNLTINTGRLLIQDGGFVTASSIGDGQGGSLVVNAAELVELSGTSADGFPSGLYAQGFGTGNAGNLQVNTDQLIVRDGARVTAATGTAANDLRLTDNTLGFGVLQGIILPNQATGNAGQMQIIANSINLDDQGSLIASTVSGEGGNMTLQAADLIEMRRNSLISAEALGGQGNGGNITIDTEFIVAVEDENSDIVADAFEGDGGNINITAQSIFGLEFRPQRTPKSDITASSQFGLAGNVEINTPDVDPSRDLIQLPTQPIDVRGLVGQVCQADAGLNQSSFVVTGRGGLPPKPNELLRGEAVFADWISLESPASDNQTTTATLSDKPSQSRQIVEAKGWIIDEQGNVILTAEATNMTSANLPVNPNFCE